MHTKEKIPFDQSPEDIMNKGAFIDFDIQPIYNFLDPPQNQTESTKTRVMA
jgi:hypothetical protein